MASVSPAAGQFLQTYGDPGSTTTLARDPSMGIQASYGQALTQGVGGPQEQALRKAPVHGDL